MTLNPVAVWWWSLPEEIQGAIIGAAATLVGALAAASVVAWQVGVQARHAIRQSRENEATKLKLQIYQGIVATCDEVINAGVAFTGYIRRFQMQLVSVQSRLPSGASFPPPDCRFPELSRRLYELSSAAIEIVRTIEKWRIIDPRIGVFQTAINVALHDINRHFNGDFVSLSIQMMPVDGPEAKPFPWHLPPQLKIAEIERLGNLVIEAEGLLGCYIDDFQREMQNMLLGELFAHRTAARRPLDPKLFAVTLAKHVEQELYFETQTDWGRTKAAAETRALDALSGQGGEGQDAAPL